VRLVATCVWANSAPPATIVNAINLVFIFFLPPSVSYRDKWHTTGQALKSKALFHVRISRLAALHRHCGGTRPIATGISPW
jgi:hypothetical protein